MKNNKSNNKIPNDFFLTNDALGDVLENGDDFQEAVFLYPRVWNAVQVVVPGVNTEVAKKEAANTTANIISYSKKHDKKQVEEYKLLQFSDLVDRLRTAS